MDLETYLLKRVEDASESLAFWQRILDTPVGETGLAAKETADKNHSYHLGKRDGLLAVLGYMKLGELTGGKWPA